MRITFFKLFLIIVLCQGLLYMIGVENFIFKLITSFFVGLLFLDAIKRKLIYYDLTFHFLILFLFLIILISAFYNNSDIISSFSFLMYLLPAYIVYIYIIKMDFNKIEIIKINNFLFLFFGFQIIFSLYKFIFLGTSEAVAGTLHYSAGSLNTIVPLIAISMLISFYANYKKRFIYLIFIIGFLFMAWIGEKRGIYFYLMLLLLVHYFSISKFSLKLIFNLIKYLPFVIVIFYFGVIYTPTLNPENAFGGSFSLSHIYDYAFNYTTQVDKYGYSGGRFSGFFAVLSNFSKLDFFTLLIGTGPDQVIGIDDNSTSLLYKYKLSQDIGINGWSTALISIGFFGAIITSLIYFYILFFSYKMFKIEKDFYWRSLSYGLYLILIVFFLDFFTYTRAFYHHIGLNVLIFYLFSILYLRFQKQI